MDEFVRKGLQVFVWDSDKDKRNQLKHGISFEKATEIFFDPWVQYADASMEDEARDAAIGRDSALRTLFVVHVLRQGNLIRIISARRAENSERKIYEDHE